LKAPEHRRTPKRKRMWGMGLAATFWTAALLRRFGQDEGRHSFRQSAN